MKAETRIGVVGDFSPKIHTHVAINEAVAHAADALGLAVVHKWVPTEAVAAENPADALDRFDGLWMAPASPYRNMDGMLAAIRFARERGRPMTAT